MEASESGQFEVWLSQIVVRRAFRLCDLCAGKHPPKADTDIKRNTAYPPFLSMWSGSTVSLAYQGSLEAPDPCVAYSCLPQVRNRLPAPQMYTELLILSACTVSAGSLKGNGKAPHNQRQSTLLLSTSFTAATKLSVWHLRTGRHWSNLFCCRLASLGEVMQAHGVMHIHVKIALHWFIT